MIVVTYLTGLTVMRMIKILSLGIPFQKIEPLVRATVGEKVTVAIEVTLVMVVILATFSE